MRFALAFVLVAGCGRVNFTPEANGDGSTEAGAAEGGVDADVTDGSDASPDGAPDTGPPVLGPFGAPRLVVEVSSDTQEDQEPSFTADLLELYVRRGDGDLFVSTRTSVDAAWSTPVPVVELNSAGVDWTPGVSPDGLSIWFGSDRPGSTGGIDIWTSTRPDRDAPWVTPTRVPELSTAGSDCCPSIDTTGTEMVTCADGVIYRTIRASPTASWSAITPIVELDSPGRDCAGRLSGDGLDIVFYSDRGGTGGEDIWMASRPDRASAFGDFVELGVLNSSGTDWDPWWSPDRRTIMFGSNRAGTHDIYVATR